VGEKSWNWFDKCSNKGDDKSNNEGKSRRSIKETVPSGRRGGAGIPERGGVMWGISAGMKKATWRANPNGGHRRGDRRGNRAHSWSRRIEAVPIDWWYVHRRRL